MDLSPPHLDVRTPVEGLSAGIEQEFQLYARGRKIHFRSIFPAVAEWLGAVPFRDLELAAVVDAGYMLACDGAEAELATARVGLAGAGALDLAGEVLRCRESLVDAVMAHGVDEVRGYSTHLNISFAHQGGIALAQRVAQLVGPSLTLLTERRISPGLLIRPRPTRLEIGTEYVDEDAPLVAGLVIFAGALSALQRGGTALEAWPRARLTRWELATMRGGIFVPHDGFGESIDLRGREARIALIDGGSIGAGELVHRNLAAAIDELGETLDSACAETATGYANVAGEAFEESVDTGRIERRTAPDPAPDSEMLVELARSRNSATRPLFLDWHGAVFEVPGADVVAAVPWSEIPVFLAKAREDDLAGVFGTQPVGEVLAHLSQLSSSGLFSGVDTAQLGEEAYSDFGNPKGKKKHPPPRVAVIGAGFSGLTAGWELTNAGYDVTVFEASDRVGGRVETDKGFIAGKTVEAGAELIGSNHPMWWELAQLFGLTLVPISEDEDYEAENLKVRWRFGAHDLTDAEKQQIEHDLEPVLETIGQEAAPINATEPWTSHNAAALDARSVADRLGDADMFGSTTSLARTFLEFTLGNDQCTPLGRQSYLGLLTAVSAHRVLDEHGQWNMLGYWEYTETHRCAGGNDQLAQRLSATLNDLRLNSPVVHLDVDIYGVWVTSNPGPRIEHFDGVVMAAPPGTWPTVASSPPFNPADYTMASGPAVKYLTKFGTTFWKPQGLAPSALWDELGVVWESTDKQPGAGGFGLSVFSGGAYVQTAAQYEQRLPVLFPNYGAAKTGARLVDWPHRPWIMTGYSTPAPGQVCTVGKNLDTPFLNRLFFAGEQASPGFFGYMEGGLQAGRRTASQVESLIPAPGGEKGHRPARTGTCCCCVESVFMGNLVAGKFTAAPVGVANFIVPYRRKNGQHKMFGHDVYTEMKMQFAPGQPGSDCVLEWWERMNKVPSWYPKQVVQYTWAEMYALLPQTFPEWNARVRPCPGGGPLVVYDHDPPGIPEAPGWTEHRVLDLRATVFSGGGCPCANASKSALASQTLTIIKGTITVQSLTVLRQNY